MTSEEKMREEFEAWCVKEIELPKGYDLNWNNDTVRLMYRGWVASRESLVIELPPAPVPSRRDGTYTIAQSAYHQGQMSVEKSIHAAGVKTK